MSDRALRARVLAREAGCWLCGGVALLPGETWQVDHVVPFHAGGAEVESNLHRCHSSCNARRSGRLVTPELVAELKRRRRQDLVSAT